MNAHIDSSHHEPGTFGCYRGHPLQRLIINADRVLVLNRLLLFDEPPVLWFASWALSRIIYQNPFISISVIDMGPCWPPVALLQCISALICICEGWMFTFYRHEVVDVHCEAFLALVNLSGSLEVGWQAIVNADALLEFVCLLSSSNPRVLKYASAALGTIVIQTCFKTLLLMWALANPLSHSYSAYLSWYAFHESWILQAWSCWYSLSSIWGVW